MRPRPSAAFAKLVLLVATVVLLTSRVALLLHEFCGHGLVATAFGGRITGWYLFLFAGGRVSYELGARDAGHRLAVSLGGIALELVLGGIALLVARRPRLRPAVAFGSLCIGTVLVGHGGLYLARGVHYGFGDGALLARLLGDARWSVALPASALVVATAVYAGRRLARMPAAVFAGTDRRVTGATLLVFVCAGLVHGGLAWIEVKAFPDPRWAAIMEDASVVAARADLARRLAAARERGEEAPSAVEQQRALEALARERRPWPLDPLLVVLVAGALVLGVARGTREGRAAASSLPSWRAIGAVAVALAAMLAIILALRRAGGPP